MGRPRKYNIENALDYATNLFLMKGYGDTSLQDLIKTMRISKSSFYYTFGSKYKLFERCINRISYEQVESAKNELRMSANGRCFLENFLYSFVNTPHSRNKHHYAFFINTTLGASERHTEISIHIAKISLRYLEVLKKAILRGQSENIISQDDKLFLAQ